jgi:DNA transposition AAA+ family ATPase
MTPTTTQDTTTTMPALHHNHTEADERDPAPAPATPAPKIKLWVNFTPEQRRRVEEIEAWQKRVGMSDEDFVAGCSVMSHQSWYQIRTGRYGAKDCSRMVGIAVEHAKQRRKTWGASQALSARPFEFIETEAYKQLVEAVEAAQAAAESGDDDKILWVVGGSGFGKTEAAKRLVAMKHARLVTASESWRSSFLDALTDFASAVGVSRPVRRDGEVKAWPSTGTVERSILAALAGKPGILCVNEVEMFSRRVLNFLRKIADETETVVVIFCVPSFYEDIQRQGGAYAEQLRTRTEDTVWFDDVEVTDVKTAITRYWPGLPKEVLNAASKALRDAVKAFGGWRRLRRIVRHLRQRYAGDGALPGLEDFNAEICAE